MHSEATALETLKFLRNNYLELIEKVDLESMSAETFDFHVKQNSPVRPFRIAAWLARQGQLISIWSLWEYYARSLCQSLPNKETKASNESTVAWVGRSLTANKIAFRDQAWFENANSLRNLIAHNGTRADSPKSNTLLAKARAAFPEIEAWQDGYICLEHEHVAELHWRVEEFIRTSR
ncbi:MAG: hypothetical protein IAG10_28960 [Planctomycetaceae bacterium]|nr:hypothetical protein [Planctomycetaceae bacterium]